MEYSAVGKGKLRAEVENILFDSDDSVVELDGFDEQDFLKTLTMLLVLSATDSCLRVTTVQYGLVRRSNTTGK